MKFNLRARLTAEFVGSAFLVAAAVGSGIMGERLAGGSVAIALLANTIATGAALVALILTFGPISGAHLNPVVTLADAMEHGIAWPEALAYIGVQCAGGITGVVLAHLMFGLRVCSHVRIAVGNLGMFTTAVRGSTVRRRQLYHRCLLVYCVNIVCQPGSNPSPMLVRYFRRDSTC
jgi:glycerol uptake facilitator-like aquaporin